MPAPEEPAQTGSIRLSFQYEERDWVSAMSAHHGSPRPAYDGIFILVLIVCGFYLWKNPRFGDYSMLLVTIAAIFAILRFLLPRVVFRTTKRFHQPYELTFSADGIHFRTIGMDSHLQWSIYNRALITPNVCLLYYDKRQFTTVPQRVFKNEEERARFDKLITEKIPSITRRPR
jgi:hypothetical protein